MSRLVNPLAVVLAALLALAGCGRAEQAGAPSMDDALVRQTVTIGRADPKDAVELGVRSLQVKDDVVVLRLLLRPRFASVEPDGEVSLYDLGGGDQLDPTLLDAENRTVYDVIREAGQSYRWQTEPVPTKVRNGEVLEAAYVLAAPPEGVRSVDLGFRKGWPRFLDVQLER